MPVRSADATEVAVSRSADGGRTWAAPVTVQRDGPGLFSNDKPQITVDPNDPNLVYATWTRFMGGEVHYTEYPGVGHNSWDKAYGDPELMKWMLSKSLPTAPAKK